MPFGPYANFEACIRDQKSKGHDEEGASKICGAMKAKLEPNYSDMEDIKKKMADVGCRFVLPIDLSEFDEETEFELITTAKQTDSRYGDFRFSKSDLQEMASNFNAGVAGTEVAVDLNHDEDHIALAWIQPGSMKVDESTKLKGEYSLYAKLYKFTPKGEEMVKTGALRYFSVEVQNSFSRIINGAKKVYNNVIRGLALTNRPVIKDMMPTFSEKPLILNFKDMEVLKKAVELILAKGKISNEDVAYIQSLAQALPESDREGADAEVAKVSERAKADAGSAEEMAKKEAATKEAAEKEAKRLAEEAAKSGKQTFSLKEVQEMIQAAVKEPLKELNKVLVDARHKSLADQVDGLMLSEGHEIGFKADAKEKVVAFVKTLSTEQADAYFALHKDIVALADLEEYGADDKPADKKLTEPLAELDKKAKELSEKEKLSYPDAVKKILATDKKLAEEVQKSKK